MADFSPEELFSTEILAKEEIVILSCVSDSARPSTRTSTRAELT